ncbi:hypothetical protein ACFQZ4_20765 [Catellatospora coxensis]
MTTPTAGQSRRLSGVAPASASPRADGLPGASVPAVVALPADGPRVCRRTGRCLP